jgi:hypothetical protein
MFLIISFFDAISRGLIFATLHLIVVTNDRQQTPCYRFAQTRGSAVDGISNPALGGQDGIWQLPD